MRTASVVVGAALWLLTAPAAAQPLEGVGWREPLVEADAALRRGEWANALALAKQADAHWPHIWGCGNAAMVCECERQTLRAAALEGVGRTGEAVAILWSMGYHPHQADVRLVELYSSAGQLKALREILDELDRRDRQQLQAQFGARFDPATMNESRRSREIRHMLAMRHAGAIEDWRSLVRELRSVSRPNGYFPRDWSRFWEPIYAARLLAARPQVTVPLVIQDLDSLQDEAATAPNWHDLALGLAGTSDAVKKLRERARTMPDEEVPSPGHWVHPRGAPFVSFVTYAGPAGNQLLQELAAAPQTKASLRRALIQWQQQKLETALEEVAFPPARNDAQLPLTADAALGKAKTP